MDRQQYREEYLNSEHWRVTRLAALDRAAHRCQVCNSPQGLDVHHRTYERLGNERPEDLTVLCRRCHDLYHGSKQEQVQPAPQPKQKQEPGLTPVCRVLYDALVTASPQSTDELMKRTGLRWGQTTGGLDALRRKRMVRRSGRKKHWIWSLPKTGELPEPVVGRPGPKPKSKPGRASKAKKLRTRPPGVAAPKPGLVRRWIDEDAIGQLSQAKQQQSMARNGEATPRTKASLADRYRA